MPTANSVGSTVFGVRSGCQAFSRCCLNAVSIVYKGWCQYDLFIAMLFNVFRTCWLFTLVLGHEPFIVGMRQR